MSIDVNAITRQELLGKDSSYCLNILQLLF